MKRKSSKKKISRKIIQPENKFDMKLSKLKRVLKSLMISFIAFVLFSVGYQFSPIVIFFVLALIAGVMSLSFFMILLIVFFMKLFRKSE